MTKVKGRFWFIGLAFVRGAMRRNLESAAAMNNLDLKIDENRGWLASEFDCEISGDKSAVDAFLTVFEERIGDKGIVWGTNAKA